MTIQKLTKEHVDALNDYLNNHVETSMFIRSNLYHSGIEYQNKPFHGDYWVSLNESKRVNGVLVQYWNGNLMMQAQSTHVLNALINSFKHTQRKPIAGILGDNSQADFVIHTLDLKPTQFSINYNEDLFALSLSHLKAPKQAQDSNFQLKPAQECESTIIKKWLVDYRIEALGSKPSPQLEAEVLDEINDNSVNKNRWVLYYKNNPVSLCGFNANLPDIVQVGPVYTPPAQRNKGYAKVIIALCLHQAKMNQVSKAILFTNNPAASNVYHTLGFQVVGQYRLAILQQPVSL